MESIGIAAVLLAWPASAFLQAVLLQFGSALALVLPLAVIAERVAVVLRKEIDDAVSAAVRDAELFRLSWDTPEDDPTNMPSWPFSATTEPSSSGVRFTLLPSPAAGEMGEPIEAILVVTDPIGRTFFRRQMSQTGYDGPGVASFAWPDDFTSGDIRDGDHRATWFVRSLAASPASRAAIACEVPFAYPNT